MDLSGVPSIDGDGIGWVTEAQMIEVDRVMTEDLGIALIQMMENAGRSLARVVCDVFDPHTVAIAVGSGGNGGGGMVCARHLANLGVDVTVVATRPRRELDGVPAHQADILDRSAIPVAQNLPPADVAVDAVVGYSLAGPPRGRALQLVEELERFAGPVVSLDTPSGLDVTTGQAPGAVVDAALTVTLALPKVGLRDAPQVGALLLADISVPPEVARRFGPDAPDFRTAPVVRLS